MSDVVPTRAAHPYHHAADLPKRVWDALFEHEAAANIVLPFASKAQHLPRQDVSGNLWIVLYDDANEVEFVLSCTKGSLGNYPVFIVACKSSTQEKGRDEHLAESMRLFVRCLLEHVSPQRVFSVFSVAQVANKFAKAFEENAPAEAGIRACDDLYYDSTFTFCTHQTFDESLDVALKPKASEDVVLSLRLADMSLLNGVKDLCKAFSETSPPFLLNDEGAELEARTMIEKQQVWVHMIEKDGQGPEIACLVATTRESDNVTAVTKVFTAERWRKRGCAARLLHRVCQDLLKKKERIVLYVGNGDKKELQSARSVYHKIGFQGLGAPQGQQVKGVERWLEIGFENTDLGHW